MFRTRTLLFIGLALALCSLPAAAKILMSPYLQAVTTDSIYVLVESDTTAPVTVEYGADTKYGKSAVTSATKPTDTTPPTYVHRIKLTKLAANHTYHYRAKQDGEPTADASFSTAVKPGTDFRFAWMADTRSQPAIHAKIAALILKAAPRFSLYGGDLCVDGSYEAFKKEFFIPEQLALAGRAPFFNAVGNHEGWRMNTVAFTQAPDSASKTQAYYSFNYGTVHFLALNTELPFDKDSAQYKFAAADLAASTQPWKIVYMHNHPYCAGGHGENAGLQAMAKEIFLPNHVNVVFSGHSHFYEHCLVEGIHYFIIGSAGAPLYTPGTAPYLVKSAKDYNYGIVDVTKGAMTITVNNAEGKELDKLVLEKK